MARTEGLEQSSAFLNKAFGKQLAPSMLISLGTTINIFVDGIIVGQYLGADGFAAVNLCMPVFLLTCAVGSLLGYGCYVLSSRAVGEGQMARSVRIYNSSYLMLTVASVVLTALGLGLCTPICAFLAAGEPELYQGVHDYAFITFAGSFFKMLLYVPLLYLRLDGRASWASVATIAMTVANIVLDVLLIIVFDWGIRGAALASVAASAVALLIGLFAMRRSKTFRFALDFESISVLLPVFRYGLVAALNNLMASLRVLLVNSLMLRLGSTMDLCIFSMLNNLNELSLFIVDGVPNAATPFLAIYSSERSYQGIRIIVRRELTISLACSLVYALVSVLFAPGIGALFGITGVELRIPALCFGVSLLCISVARVLIFYYNAHGKNVLSNVITCLRLLVMPVLGLLYLFKVGALVWLFLPLGELAGLAVLAAVLAITHLAHKDRSWVLQLPLAETGDETALEFSVKADDESICDASARVGDYCADNGLSPKEAMRISLALEEVLALIRQKSFPDRPEETFDLRVFCSEEHKGIRIRDAGASFNPFLDDGGDMADEYMGVRLITNMAHDIEYNFVCGINNILIFI